MLVGVLTWYVGVGLCVKCASCVGCTDVDMAALRCVDDHPCHPPLRGVELTFHCF